MIKFNDNYLNLLKDKNGYFKKSTLKKVNLYKTDNWKVDFLNSPKSKGYTIFFLRTLGYDIPNDATEEWIANKFGGQYIPSQERQEDLISKDELLSLIEKIEMELHNESFNNYPQELALSERGFKYDKNKYNRNAFLSCKNKYTNKLKSFLGL